MEIKLDEVKRSHLDTSISCSYLKQFNLVTYLQQDGSDFTPLHENIIPVVKGKHFQEIALQDHPPKGRTP